MGAESRKWITVTVKRREVNDGKKTLTEADKRMFSF
jgi:hypothetical protein